MAVPVLLGLLGDHVVSAEEETFDLFAQDLPSRDLGFVDPKAPVLELTVAGRDLTIHQSPGLLSSDRAGGTTGAVVWAITPLFAAWLASPSNPLFTSRVLSPSAAVLELGCGISALVGLVVGPRVAQYVLTDQPYVARLVGQNMAANRQRPRQHHPSRRPTLRFAPLDWEADEVTPALAGPDDDDAAAAVARGSFDAAAVARGSFDAVVACDCVYNDALVEPLVAACRDVCSLRRRRRRDDGRRAASAAAGPCVCVVAQQLRDPEVFELWLACFMRSFRVWRVPDALLPEGLRAGSGFVSPALLPGYFLHFFVLAGAVPWEKH
ncbi:hypothetical protein P8C59_006829 [Phyllachora maydis]|uniref:Uncharacterized protein n=1 Tax=Phyllachora maydis TaxID=1825666 RepID=A0AAD9I7M2_9PEZI|nr:hypothetical protein P8C59_006829 [Phyllachora maydis]